MDKGNWVPMDKSLVAALPRKRPYTLIEAASSFQVDLDKGEIKGYRDYARIWGWSKNRAIEFIRDKQRTNSGHARDTTNDPNPNPKTQSLKIGTMEFSCQHKNSTALSFEEYKEKNHLTEETIIGIKYFMRRHKQFIGKNHPKLKEQQWEQTAQSLFWIYDDNMDRSMDIDLDSLKVMINRYFEVQWKDGCNYSILHFYSPGMKVRRMYEVAYHCSM